MVPFSDPVLDGLISAYIRSSQDIACLHPGSKDDITAILQTWITRRKDTYKQQMQVRNPLNYYKNGTSLV